MKRLLPSIVAIAILQGITFTAAADTAHPKDLLNVGTLLCLSGNCADWGSAALKGSQLAAKEINARGGILGKTLNFVVEDTRESVSGAQAVTAFHKLTADEKIHFIVGPSWSPGALAIAPLASKRRDLIMLTPSASSQDFNRAGANLFNLRPIEDQITASLARFAVHQGWRRVAVLSSSQPAEATQGRIFKDIFSQEGGTIVRYVETSPDLSDLKTEALQIVTTKPDAIFLIAYTQMVSAVKNFQTLGYKGKLLTISIDDARVVSAQGRLEGAIVAKAAAPSE